MTADGGGASPAENPADDPVIPPVGPTTTPAGADGASADLGMEDPAVDPARDPDPRPTAEPSSTARRPVVHLRLGRDERAAVSADGDHPLVMGSYLDDAGRPIFELFSHGEVESRSLLDLLGDAAVAHRTLSPDCVPDPEAVIFHYLGPETGAKAFVLQGHLTDVLDGRPPGDSSNDAESYNRETTTRTDRRKAKMKELGWSPSTMSRREAAFRERGILGLVPYSGWKAQLKELIECEPVVLAIVLEHCQDWHLASKKDLQTLYAAVSVDLRRRGIVSRTRGTPGPGGTELDAIEEVLPYHRFVALVRQLNRGRTHQNAKTRYEQSKRPMNGPLRHRAYGFGEMIQVDATPTDFFVRGPDGEARRAYAVFAVCVSTKMMWLRLTDEPPRGRDLALLLFDILGGHSLVRAEQFAQLATVPTRLAVNAFPPNVGPPPGVLPTSIRLDHGPEEENQLWIGLCAQLGITLEWAATATPTDKAHVESLISTFARRCQLVPSHKGNTVVNRPQFIDPGTIPTLEQARRAFGGGWQEWAANQPHTGLQVETTNRYLTPMQAVRSSLTYGNPVAVLADPTLALRLLPVKLLTPQDDGVTWERRRYWCEDYQELITASTARGDRRKLVFFYDPEAKHRLYWIEPGTFRVRRLSSPGADSGIQPAFDSVRRMIADTLGQTGQKWPTHTEIGQSQADLLELMQQSWADDGLDPAENVVPLRPTPGRAKRKRLAQETEVGNNGWRLEDFAPIPLDFPAADWDDGISDAPGASATGSGDGAGGFFGDPDAETWADTWPDFDGGGWR